MSGVPEEIAREVPGEGGTPVFAAPWQARIFAIVARLAMDGRFGWDDFKDRLVAEIDTSGAADGADYYERFTAACERLLTETGTVSVTELAELRAELVAHPPHPNSSTPGPIAVDPARRGA